VFYDLALLHPNHGKALVEWNHLLGRRHIGGGGDILTYHPFRRPWLNIARRVGPDRSRFHGTHFADHPLEYASVCPSYLEQVTNFCDNRGDRPGSSTKTRHVRPFYRLRTNLEKMRWASYNPQRDCVPKPRGCEHELTWSLGKVVPRMNLIDS